MDTDLLELWGRGKPLKKVNSDCPDDTRHPRGPPGLQKRGPAGRRAAWAGHGKLEERKHAERPPAAGVEGVGGNAEQRTKSTD